MRIVFVRHGHPDYRLDCLTEVGRQQAQAVAERLSAETPAKIYASTLGRAYETAQYIADRLKMSIEKCDFMREIRWGFMTEERLEDDGQPWKVADEMVASGQNVMDVAWEKESLFASNTVVFSVQKVSSAFDEWLRAFGFEREGHYYRVTKQNSETVFMVSHGGSSSAVLSHLLSIPFPQFCAMIRPDFTAITVVTLTGKEGDLVVPRIELLNDSRHIERVNEKIIFGN